MKVFLLVIMFFFIGALFIISENNLALSVPGNIDKAAGLYHSWLSQIFDNAKNMTGYLVKMDWLPEGKNSSG
jgi:hypothetical protein